MSYQLKPQESPSVLLKKGGMSLKHEQLQDRAIRWLYDRGCSVFAKEVPTQNGTADALGVKTPPSYRWKEEEASVYYIEAKASRSDLICRKQKCTYYRCFDRLQKDLLGNLGVDESTPRETGITYYYLIVADGVKVEDTLYPSWGVINESGEVVRKARKFPRSGSAVREIKDIAHVLVYKCFGKLYL